VYSDVTVKWNGESYVGRAGDGLEEVAERLTPGVDSNVYMLLMMLMPILMRMTGSLIISSSSSWQHLARVLRARVHITSPCRRAATAIIIIIIIISLIKQIDKMQSYIT